MSVIESIAYLIVARSALSDQSFKICEFADDPLPLGDRIRSFNVKTLLRK